MKKLFSLLFGLLLIVPLALNFQSCEHSPQNKTAILEQQQTELNQTGLLNSQPPPRLSWSLERDNLIKRFRLQNDRTVAFYMYIFIEGCVTPIGYYQINKVSSVNSQLTNTMQMVNDPNGSAQVGSCVLPSPAEDGSYGENGGGVFGFTPEDIYIEHNMHYMCSTVPLTFREPVIKLTVINIETEKQLKEMMAKINKDQ